ncbi:helix-turn-helix domain-containing protein [Streptomyces goshikiensis]|uniref:helix-turn-helix domain-containing protein n=1 Tax=Streptomyces goshikiensis TaxID=1942 RepID=UPI0037227FAF
MVDLDVDLHATLWSVAEAAEAARVSPNVVRNWAYRGRLEAAESDRHGRPRYRAIDVIRAEKATRERARRSYSLQAA